MSTDNFSLSRGAPGSVATSDFGHSLMAGLSDHYLPDFVLHGTSQPPAEFRSKLVSDLAAFVKVSSTNDMFFVCPHSGQMMPVGTYMCIFTCTSTGAACYRFFVVVFLKFCLLFLFHSLLPKVFTHVLTFIIFQDS